MNHEPKILYTPEQIQKLVDYLMGRVTFTEAKSILGQGRRHVVHAAAQAIKQGCQDGLVKVRYIKPKQL